ncbi:DUF5926 family protein [Ornithinimicrobium sp. INDO-MA30-4]|uniref:DUF5926 family protein n=1 Tax=Ornithinimicrobium sp. INDO-MA30-4 TaxID=2908651 RepID=UPI001F1C7C01|nr:DUF5926 family protein [Ornithinimicrobium sp. INDO-MA30-4]UJH69829.1 DUF5926 family protein [Ornithinimicrobium sp. INDO-MA30-4]
MARPFAGLANEGDWVAMREIVPSATAPITVKLPEQGEVQVTLATVLPGAMPGLHREDGEMLVALQSRTSSGDASRDIAAAIIAVAGTEPGTPHVSPRRDGGHPSPPGSAGQGSDLEPTVHEDFAFWVGDAEATPEVASALEATNDAAAPTAKIDSVESAYWTKMGERTYIRWILSDNEDLATKALARLQAAGEHTLGGDSVLLGAFRAAGLLAPVLEVPADTEAAEHGEALAALAKRYEKALKVDTALTPDERRAREGLVSRQVTLR